MMEKIRVLISLFFVFMGVSTADSENLLIPIAFMIIGFLIVWEYIFPEKKENRRK